MAKLSESPFQSPFCSLHKGTSVLLNVFQRADENDNGLLSRQEFIDFFFDGILTEDELIDIFDEVDLHHNGNINSSDLCTFLWMHLGIFEPALAALEDLSLNVSQASSSVDKLYKRESIQTQFVMRFMLKEIQHQIQVFNKQLQILSAKLEEDVIPVIDRKSPPVINCKNRFPIIPRVKPIRLKKQMVTQTSLHIEDTSQDLDTQVRKLEKLVRQLENQPLLKKTMEVDIDENEEKLLLLVQQSLPAETSAIEQFRESLKIYAEETKIMEGCLHVCIKLYNTVTTFVVYEVWDSETVWNKYRAVSGFNFNRLYN